MHIHDANRLLYTPTAITFFTTTMDMLKETLKPQNDEVYTLIDSLAVALKGATKDTIHSRYPNLTDDECKSAAAAVIALTSGFLIADVFSQVASLVNMDDTQMDAANAAFKAAGASGLMRVAKAKVPKDVAEDVMANQAAA